MKGEGNKDRGGRGKERKEVKQIGHEVKGDEGINEGRKKEWAKREERRMNGGN